ncbi:MAG: response regulator [Myxococcales bacterium FL481]|nr:MAG: response regulator [Myxococcales bacterium FL481]
MAESPDTEREQELLEALWTSIPAQAGEILGTEISLGSMKTADLDVDKYRDCYIAVLSTEQPQAVDMFLLFDVKSAIAFSGLLVMMQEKVIREKMTRREMVEDDLDAMGECVNQIGSVITDAVRQSLGPAYHMRFSEGAVDGIESLDKYAGARILSASGKLSIGSLHTGRLTLAMPEQMFTGESAEAGQADGAGSGVELSPEEAAAIRQATLDGLGSVPTIALLLPVDRERSAWEERFEQATLPVIVVRDAHSVRRLVQSGDVGVVVIDADACPSGGLAALAQVLAARSEPLPVFLAASNPTRVHVVSCLASGAASYFAKPIEADDMRSRIEDTLAEWPERSEISA